jgi:YYY domain-containing protein
VLVIALALNWLLVKRAPVRSGLEVTAGGSSRSDLGLLLESLRYVWQRLDWGQVLVWILWPLSLGALWAINSWDWPAYAGLSGLILLIAWIRARGRQGVIPALLAGVALAGGSLVLYLPFITHYAAIFVGLGWGLSRGQTLLGEFMTMWAFQLFVAVSLLLVLLLSHRNQWGVLRIIGLALRYPTRLHRVERLYRASTHHKGRSHRISIAAISILLVLMIITAWKGYWVLFVMLPLLALTLALFTQPQMSPERRFTLALLFTAFLILVGIELFYLKDHLDGGGAWRMNTLFKFYLQAWVMIGLAVGTALPGIWRAVDAWRSGTRWLWTSVLGLLIAAAALYPLLGTPARVMDRFPGARPPIGTLDGMAFMTVGTYTWPTEDNPIHLLGDYRAIQWLNENVKGTPVLAEAPIGYYREFGVRVASYTGLPTLLGMHESEQRYGWQVGERSGRANAFFITSDLAQTLSIIQELHIEYIYLGPLERTQYPVADQKFERLAASGSLSVAYENDAVTIYRVSQPN